MRARAYGLFELVAWPAAAWAVIEVGLRLATRNFDGLAMTAATGTLAGLTIVACRQRSTQLAAGAELLN